MLARGFVQGIFSRVYAHRVSVLIPMNYSEYYLLNKR